MMDADEFMATVMRKTLEFVQHKSVSGYGLMILMSEGFRSDGNDYDCTFATTNGLIGSDPDEFIINLIVPYEAEEMGVQPNT